MLTDTSDHCTGDCVGAAQSPMIFEVENYISDFCSDLLSPEEYSLNKLDNVVFSLSRERNVLKTNNFPCQDRLVSMSALQPEADPSI